MRRFVLPAGKDAALAFIADLPDKPAMVVEIKKATSKSTSPQKAAIHGAIRVAAEFTGYEVEELKDYLKDAGNFYDYAHINGRTVARRESIAQMSTARASEFYDFITRHCAQAGIPTVRGYDY